MEDSKVANLVDTHAHLDMMVGNERELPRVLEGAKKEGVSEIISVGIDLASSRKAIHFAENFDGVYAAVGIHPNDANLFSGDALKELEGLSENTKVKAWGEIGLDFYRDYTPRKVQYDAFEAQLQAASKRGLPVIIHARDALSECIEIISEFSKRNGIQGVFHCFSGSTREATRVLDLGFYLSFTGVITFPNAKGLRDVAAFVPIDRILIETDSPFLSPVPFRGKPNEPGRVRFVAEAISRLKKMDFLEVALCTTRNARALFGLSVQ